MKSTVFSDAFSQNDALVVWNISIVSFLISSFRASKNSHEIKRDCLCLLVCFSLSGCPKILRTSSKQNPRIVVYEIIVFIRVKNIIRISRNIKIILPFTNKFFGQSVKQRKPRKMTVLRNGYYLIREFNDVTEIRVVRYNCITSLRRIFILPLIKE